MKQFIADLKLGMGTLQLRGGNTDFAFSISVALDFFRAQVPLWGCSFSSEKNPFLLCTWPFPAGDEAASFPRSQTTN